MKSPSPLQRGMACLCCRKRKMKCDGARPVCAQCIKSNRSTECHYHEKKQTSRTQMLQQKVAKLEARLRELEAEQAESSASSSSSPVGSVHLALTAEPSPPPPGSEQQHHAWDHPEFSFADLNAAVPAFDTQMFGGSSPSSWPGDFLDIPLSIDQTLAQLTDPSLAVSGFPTGSTSSKWWEDSNSFCQNKQMLLDIFFEHRHQCALDVHVGRFQASLSLPPPHQPHPALMDAIYLLACYFSRCEPLQELESHFLKRALQGISEALQHSDRIINVLQASCLLAVYFFCHGRILEGYYHSSIAARLAVGLGLHQIRSGDWFQLQLAMAGFSEDLVGPLKASVPLSPPVDGVEYAERIAAFWQVFVVDRAWSVATGLPTALPDDDHPKAQIETIWPLPIVEAPSNASTNGTVRSLYECSVVTGDNLSATSTTSTTTLRAKAVALFERSHRFSNSSAKTDMYWVEHRSLEMSLAQFSVNLPCIGGRNGHQAPLSATDIELVNVHTLIYAATIYLNRTLADIQPTSYEKCLIAASSVTSLLRELSDRDYELLDPISSTCWRAVADLYIHILSSPDARALQCTVDVIDQELDLLISAMKKLGIIFYVAGIHATKTEHDRTVARTSLSV